MTFVWLLKSFAFIHIYFTKPLKQNKHTKEKKNNHFDAHPFLSFKLQLTDWLTECGLFCFDFFFLIIIEQIPFSFIVIHKKEKKTKNTHNTLTFVENTKFNVSHIGIRSESPYPFVVGFFFLKKTAFCYFSFNVPFCNEGNK